MFGGPLPQPRLETVSIILGLDLAETTGICVLQASDHSLVWSDSVRLAIRNPQSRLIALKQLIQEALRRFGPGEMALEDVFLPVRTSPRTPISLGELRGVARLCAAEADMPVFFYQPRKVKMTVTGNGAASKEDVIQIITMEFQTPLKDDNQADAISVAYTHWLIRQFEQPPDDKT